MLDLSSNLAFLPSDYFKEKFNDLFKKGDNVDETSTDATFSNALTSIGTGGNDDDEDKENQRNNKRTYDQFASSDDSEKEWAEYEISDLSDWKKNPEEDFYKYCDPNDPESIKQRQFSALLGYLQIRDSKASNAENTSADSTDDTENSILSTTNKADDSTSSAADKSKNPSKKEGKKRME
jgi:hypothetical protein